MMNVFTCSNLIGIDYDENKLEVFFILFHSDNNAHATHVRYRNTGGSKMSFQVMKPILTTYEVRTQKVLKVPVTLF